MTPASPSAPSWVRRWRVVADFEAALVRGRTVEGMQMARVKGHLTGRSPKLRPAREEHVVQLYEAGEYTTSEIGELLNISRSTVYRAVKRAAKAKLAEHPDVVLAPSNPPRRGPPTTGARWRQMTARKTPEP